MKTRQRMYPGVKASLVLFWTKRQIWELQQTTAPPSQTRLTPPLTLNKLPKSLLTTSDCMPATAPQTPNTISFQLPFKRNTSRE